MLPIFQGNPGLTPNTRFLESTGVHNQNYILICLVIFAARAIVANKHIETDRQRDRQTERQANLHACDGPNNTGNKQTKKQKNMYGANGIQ